MKKRILSAVLTVFLGASMIFSGCGTKNAENEETKEAGDSAKMKSEDDDILSVKISAINAISWAPVFIAQTEGFFEEQGINAEFTTPGGPKGFQAMQAGDCDFAMLSQEPLLIAQEQGLESTIIAAMLKTRVYGLVATPDIKDIEQLKGKKIFGSDAGSAPYTFISNVLRLAGLDPLKDVNFVQISDNNAGLQAFLNGEVDAAFVNMYTLPAAGEFEYQVLADCTDSEQCEKYLGSAEFPGEMLCTTTAFAKENPEICQKVVNAVIDAQLWIAEHTDKEVAASLKPVFGDIDEAVIAEQAALIRSEYAVDCLITESGQQAVINMCVEAGIISEPISYEDVIDMSFAENYGK